MAKLLGFVCLVIVAAYAAAALLQVLASWGLIALVFATVGIAWVACRLAPDRARGAAWFATTCLFLFGAFWEPLHGRRPPGPWAELDSGLRMAMVYYPLMVVIGIVVAEPFRGRRQEREGEVEAEVVP